jgi:nitrogen fixation NifU-like protein
MENTNERELLRNQIIKHFSDPQFKGHTNEGEIFESKSSVCSDTVALEISSSDEIVKHARFIGEGCAISLAASDVFCEVIENKSLDEIACILDEYEKMLKKEEFDESILEELTIFRQIPNQRSRIACAKLPTIGLEIFLNKIKKM